MQISFTWTDQSNYDVKYSPKCLCELTLSIKVSLNIRGGELFRHLLENIMSFDFLALNVTFHVSAHNEIFSRSLFNMAAVSDGSEPASIREVSSANIKISLSMSLMMSFM